MRLYSALFLLLLPGLASAQAGRFLLAVGDVVVVRGAQQIRPGVGAAVESGDTIRVGVDSNAQIRMSDESIIGLRPSSTLRIDEYSFGRGDGSERSLFTLLKGGFRTVTGAIGRLHDRNKYAVRTATSTVGIRGTHYVIVQCDNDCGENTRLSLASAAAAQLSQVDAGKPPAGPTIPNGTYGAVTDGSISVTNQTGDHVFGANQYFHVASADATPQGLIAPPPFVHDRLPAQNRSQGKSSGESTANMGQSGANAESRDSKPPLARQFGGSDKVSIDPAPPVNSQITRADTGTTTSGTTGFAVLDTKTSSGSSAIVGSTFDTAFVGGASYLGCTDCDIGGALGNKSQLTFNGSQLSSVTIPAGCTGPNDGCSGGFSATNLGTPTQAGSATIPNSTSTIFWGAWNSGTINDGQVYSLSNNNQAHLMYAPLTPDSVIAAKSGTVTFQTSSLGTTATNNLGQSSSGGTYPTLNINFGARTVAISASSINFPSQNWSLSGGTVPITLAGGGAFFRGQGSASCTGSCSSTGTGTLAGIFVGPFGDHATVGLSGNAGTAFFHTVRVYCPTC